MDNNTSEQKRIMEVSNELEVAEEVIEAQGKVLHVTSETEGLDFKALLAKAVQCFDMGNAIGSIERHMEYAVQVPLKYKDALIKGDLFMMQNQKNGNMWPTLMRKLENGKNQIVEPLPIKEQGFIQGDPLRDIARGYQNLYMQRQLGELADQMKITYKAVERIEQGQMDDRIAKLISGHDQIVLALNLPDEKDRKLALANGRSEIITAQKQIFQTFKRRVESFPPLPEGELAQLKLEVFNKGTLRECYQAFDEIQEYYELYLQATDMLAASYALCGDTETAEKTYNLSIGYMREVNFNNIKTLDYVRDKQSDLFYNHALEYIETEKDICLETAEEYEFMQIEMTGQQLLEVFNNGEEAEIQEAETGQAGD